MFIILLVIGFIGGIIVTFVYSEIKTTKLKEKDNCCPFCDIDNNHHQINKIIFLDTEKIVHTCKKHKLSKELLKICNNISDINYLIYKEYMKYRKKHIEFLKQKEIDEKRNLDRFKEIDPKFERDIKKYNKKEEYIEDTIFKCAEKIQPTHELDIFTGEELETTISTIDSTIGDYRGHIEFSDGTKLKL
jgi:hypothetical protein